MIRGLSRYLCDFGARWPPVACGLWRRVSQCYVSPVLPTAARFVDWLAVPLLGLLVAQHKLRHPVLAREVGSPVSSISLVSV